MDNGHILIIDDDQSTLKMAAELLEDLYQVSLASSGAIAMRLMQRGIVPDIILLDIDMPGMNGYEVLSMLKAQPATCHIPVIFLTGATDVESEVYGLKLGACDYIKKPFVQAILLARLAVHLDLSKRLKAQGQLDETLLNDLKSPLTETELKVAHLMAAGHSNVMISKQLNYSYEYIKKVASRVLGKLEIDSRKDIGRYLK